MEHFLAIDNVCAWPNLTVLPDQTLVATVFNQPTHGIWEGEVECWGSGDGGLTWKLRGVPVRHEAGTNRMNHAAGLTRGGELVVLVSGWNRRVPPGTPKTHSFVQSEALPAAVARSGDGGRTWSVHERFPKAMRAGFGPLIPFGDVVVATDGALCVGAYDGELAQGNASTAMTPDKRLGNVYLVRSRDEGATWEEVVVVAQPQHVEAALLHLGGGKWLAAPRALPALTQEIFASEDDGRSWEHRAHLGVPATSASHLLRLRDGRLLLTYGSRAPSNRGIDARLSQDGVFWSAPRRLVALPDVDLGYPAAVQLADDTVVIAYYVRENPFHRRYHMAVMRLTPGEL